MLKAHGASIDQADKAGITPKGIASETALQYFNEPFPEVCNSLNTKIGASESETTVQKTEHSLAYRPKP